MENRGLDGAREGNFNRDKCVCALTCQHMSSTRGWFCLFPASPTRRQRDALPKWPADRLLSLPFKNQGERSSISIVAKQLLFLSCMGSDLWFSMAIFSCLLNNVQTDTAGYSIVECKHICPGII